MGENSFPVYISETEAGFPYSWCLKRLYDGPGDDVWSKYSVFVLKDMEPERKGILSRIFGR
jgi:hypothetical protein